MSVVANGMAAFCFIVGILSVLSCCMHSYIGNKEAARHEEIVAVLLFIGCALFLVAAK